MDRKATGTPVTIRDVATGDVEISAFCPNCEVKFDENVHMRFLFQLGVMVN